MSETPTPLPYRLPAEFRRLFEGKVYKHRDSSQGDFVAMHLYEDLVTVNRSPKYVEAVLSRKDRVVNFQNKRRGVAARRGDGTFGEIIPGETPVTGKGYLVSRGPIATVEIGVEVKILAKAMIKQIDRVINDLRNQVVQFRRGGGNPICVAVVGINQADGTVGYEGDRPFYDRQTRLPSSVSGSAGRRTTAVGPRCAELRRIRCTPLQGNQRLAVSV